MQIETKKRVLAEDAKIINGVIEYFLNFSQVNSKGISYFKKNISVNRVKKTTIIIEPGIPNTYLYFISKGVLRGYIKDRHKEITTWINSENDIVGTIRNLGTDQPTNEIVQAIEDCNLVAIPIDVIENMYDRFPETNKIGRLIVSANYRYAEERAFIARIPSAEERYQRFMKYRGDLINRISLKYVASYLGMSLETLSRIRSRKS